MSVRSSLSVRTWPLLLTIALATAACNGYTAPASRTSSSTDRPDHDGPRVSTHTAHQQVPLGPDEKANDDRPPLLLGPATFVDATPPTEIAQDEQLAALQDIFPGFEVDVRQKQIGVNRYTPTPGGDPIFAHHFVVKRGEQILAGTARINRRLTRFFAEHPDVVDGRGMRIGATYAEFIERHGPARCRLEYFSGWNQLLSRRQLLLCDSKAIPGEYAFEAAQIAKDSTRPLDESQLQDLELVQFTFVWVLPRKPASPNGR